MKSGAGISASMRYEPIMGRGRPHDDTKESCLNCGTEVVVSVDSDGNGGLVEWWATCSKCGREAHRKTTRPAGSTIKANERRDVCRKCTGEFSQPKGRRGRPFTLCPGCRA